jgi:hypothetical protein
VPVGIVEVRKIVRIANVFGREVRLETSGKVNDFAMLIFFHRFDGRENSREQFSITHEGIVSFVK